MFVIMSKKNFRHRNHMATNTYKELQRVEVELEEEKRARALAQAMAEGYANMTMKMEKEIEFYRNMYEREKRKNEDRENNSDFMHRNYSFVRVVPRVRGYRLP